MELLKIGMTELSASAKRHKLRTAGALAFVTLIALGVHDHNCNPQEEFVLDNPEPEEISDNPGTGMIPLENGLTAEII